MCGSDVFLVLLSVLFPPIGVWVKRGVCSADGLINIALCCLGFFPGLIHAWYIIYTYPERQDYQPLHASDDGRQGRQGGGPVGYYVIHPGQPQRAPKSQQRSSGQPQSGGYGTVAQGNAPNSQFPGQQSGTSNAFPQKGTSTSKAASAPAPAEQQAGSSSSGGPSEAAPPPSYADVIKGDFKVQTQD